MEKYINIVRKFSWVLLRQNVVNAFTYNIRKEILTLNQSLYLLSNKLRHTQFELLYYKILDYYSRDFDGKYTEEIKFLKNNGRLTEFPYPKTKGMELFTCAHDSSNGLPYVLHKEKKLYYPKTWSLTLVNDQYRNLVEKENILGGGYSSKSPHQYQTDHFHVYETDTVLDIGAAEGLFALEVIESVEKVVLIEADALWVEPLRATFEPYKHKVTIINKFVSDIDGHNEITIESCLRNSAVKTLFIKMDIEGEECRIIRNNQSLLSKDLEIRVVCCTYHNSGDADKLKLLLDNAGYKTEFSEGFVLFIWDENLQPPYFRKGLIRGKK